jgi:hypothetical protein
MHRAKLVVKAILVVGLVTSMGLVGPARPVAAAGPIHLVMHVQPGTRIDSYAWTCARQPDECIPIDGFRYHLSSRLAGQNGLAEEWLAYGNVVVLESVVRQYSGGLQNTFVYQPQAVVAALKYPLNESSATVDIWPEDPKAGSYVAGPFVVLLQNDISELFGRISQRAAAGEEETEDLWKAEIANLAGRIKPGW